MNRYKEAFADRVFAIIDEKCPGFSSSVIGEPQLVSSLLWWNLRKLDLITRAHRTSRPFPFQPSRQRIDQGE
jgi:hypothetical protein